MFCELYFGLQLRMNDDLTQILDRFALSLPIYQKDILIRRFLVCFHVCLVMQDSTLLS